MYVCICKGVTENVIREAVGHGAERMRDLKACLGITTQCGTCACHAKQVLDQALIQKTSEHQLGPNSVCLQKISAYEA